MYKYDKFNNKVLQYQDVPLYVIFYIEGCPFCEDAFELLESKGVPYKGYNLKKIKGGRDTARKMFTKHKGLTGFKPTHKTVPMIFFKGEFVGGFDQLEDHVDRLTLGRI